MSSGLRIVDDVAVLPLDGLWDYIEGVPAEQKLGQALEYAGCDFHDNDRQFVAGHVLALVGVGGLPIAHISDTEEKIRASLISLAGSREIMGSAAAFSYLNSGEKSIDELYKTATDLGHFSIAHTVYLNFVIAGISEAAELELSLQRDLVHLSKLTNARTKVQNRPPLVVPNAKDVDQITRVYQIASEVAASLRTDSSGDTLEYANSVFGINKATLLMMSGDLSNLRKLAQLRDDKGKERELRELLNKLHGQLDLLWPEIMKNKE